MTQKSESLAPFLSKPKIPSACLLSPELIETLQELFNEIDVQQDLVVKRKDLVTKLRGDIRIIRSMHLPALYLQKIDKTLNLERVLNRIEQEGSYGTAEELKNKEFMTWNQLLGYFEDNTAQSEAVETNRIEQLKVLSSIKDNQDDQDDFDF